MGFDIKALLDAIAQLIREERDAIPDSNLQISQRNGPDTLTEKEIHIIQCVGLGQKDDETATQLEIQISTLRSHLSHIYHKVGVTNRLGLIVYAYKHHLAFPPE